MQPFVAASGDQFQHRFIFIVQEIGDAFHREGNATTDTIRIQETTIAGSRKRAIGAGIHLHNRLPKRPVSTVRLRAQISSDDSTGH